MRLAPWIACGLLLLAGCDRPPLDPLGGDVVVVSPDLDAVLDSPSLRLQLQARDGGVERVTVRGKEATYNASRNLYVATVELADGLNALPVETFSGGSSMSTDTLFAVYLPVAAVPVGTARAPTVRVDAAGLSLPDGRSLLTGGFGVDGRPLASASVVQLDAQTVTSTDVPLLEARAGHTATPLPDGSVLLLGGVRAELPVSSDFVGTAEVFDPRTGSSRPVEVAGGTFARSGHVTCVLRTASTTYVYAFGGRTPTEAASSTVDVLEWLPAAAQLRRLSPSGGAGSFPPVVDAVLVAGSPEGSEVAAAVVLGLNRSGGVATRLGWSVPGSGPYPFDLHAADTGGLVTARTEAAAAPLGPLAVVTGGRDAQGAVLGSAEVYAPPAHRAFRFGPAVGLRVPKAGHTATILAGRRMLLAGGRDAAGSPVSTVELFQF